MASGGSSSRPPSGSRSFDFGSDDVLCSYDDFATQDSSNGKRSDPPSMDYHESRMGKPLVSIYEQDEYSKEDIMTTVEKCMKKYADNLLRYLEGIGGRLSQLEIYCYKLERSIGEFRADIHRDQSDTDVKFKNLEKHLQEVHRSVQILRDKQELAETQKELTKLQVAHKESAAKNEDGTTKTSSEPKKVDDKPDMGNQQLALALPHQVAGSPQLSARASDPVPHFKELSVQQQAPVGPNAQLDRYIVNQTSMFYPQRQPFPQDQQRQPFPQDQQHQPFPQDQQHQPFPQDQQRQHFPQDQQNQQVAPEIQYVQQRPQLQEVSVQPPPRQPQTVSQNQPQAFPQYQQQWPQQVPQQIVQPQQVPSQAQIRPQAPYTPYPLHSVNPASETFPSNMPMQGPYPPALQPSTNRSEAVPFGYGGTGGSVPQSSPQHNLQRQTQALATQGSFGQQPNKGTYMSTAPYPPQYNLQGYNSGYNYGPSNLPAVQNQPLPPSSSASVHGTQLIRNHPYAEMIEKAVGMGYPRDQVASVVQRMADSGQPMDFNAVLDRLNGQAPGVPSRVW